MLFFIEVALSGLMAGVMYSLVALGFVLIFKASGIFNFAQGVMALFAALTLVGLMEKFHFPVWLAIIGTIAVMIALALFTVSLNSSSGIESATTPAPACTVIQPSRITIVRIVIAMSMLPEKSR